MAARTDTLRHWTRRGACAALATLALAGCGLLGGGGSVPQQAYYRLTAADVPARAGGPLAGIVEVPALRADGLLGDRSILYRAGGASLISGYHYHAWWEAPGIMLQESLADALRRANAFQLVTAPELRLDRTYEIVGRIRSFEQQGASVHVEIELMLRSVRSGLPLLMKTYVQDARATDETVPAAVDAFSTAVGQVWTQFVMDLGTVTPPPPPPRS